MLKIFKVRCSFHNVITFLSHEIFKSKTLLLIIYSFHSRFLNLNKWWLYLAEWYAFIGRKAGLGVPGSPYAINFLPTAPESLGMKPMNVSIYSCGDTSLGCSCGDCPSSVACSNSDSPSPPKKGSCSVRIGSLNVRKFILDACGNCRFIIHSDVNNYNVMCFLLLMIAGKMH